MQDSRNWDLCCLQAVLNCAPRRLSGPEVSAFLSSPDSPPSRRNPELGKRVLALRLWRLLPAARQVGSCTVAEPHCWHRHPRFHQGPLLCGMVVGKSREGVPTWDGDPSTWTTYRRSALLFVESTKWENRYLCGPRLASELTGPAKASIASKKPTWLSHENGVARLLKHLQEVISEPILPEVGNALRSYFRTLRRKRGETMTSFCVRHREEYEKACRALTRMMGSQKHGLQRDHDGRTSSQRSSWWGAMRQDTSGPDRQSGGSRGGSTQETPASSLHADAPR